MKKEQEEIQKKKQEKVTTKVETNKKETVKQDKKAETNKKEAKKIAEHINVYYRGIKIKEISY